MEEKNKNCYTCKFMNIEKFIFNGENKPCEHYPKELSTAPDIVSGFCCEFYQQVKIENIKILKDKKLNMQVIPFFMTTSIVDLEQELQKTKKNIERNNRLIDWISGFFFGLSLGLYFVICILLY